MMKKSTDLCVTQKRKQLSKQNQINNNPSAMLFKIDTVFSNNKNSRRLKWFLWTFCRCAVFVMCILFLLKCAGYPVLFELSMYVDTVFGQYYSVDDRLFRGRPFANMGDLVSNYSIPFDLYQSWPTNQVAHFRYKEIVSFFKHNKKWNYYLFYDTSPDQSNNHVLKKTGSMDSWIQEHIQNDNATPLKLFTKNEMKKIGCAYSMLIVGAAKCDLWRHLIIYKNGGMYLDFDAVLSKAYMSKIILPGDEFIASMRDNVEIDQYFVISRKEHPIIKQTIVSIVENILNTAYYQNIYFIQNGIDTTKIKDIDTFMEKSKEYKQFLTQICKLFMHPTHSMKFQNDKINQHTYNELEMRSIINGTKFGYFYCFCDNVYNSNDQLNKHAKESRYFNVIHAACLTGPSVYKQAIETVLFNKKYDQLTGYHFFNNQGLNGAFEPKFIDTKHQLVNTNLLEKTKAGRRGRGWITAKFRMINYTNQCWKQFYS